MLSLRPITPEDAEFLQRVYASTRADELALLPWSAAQKEAFTRMQFEAQAEHYNRHYPGASLSVIEVDGQPAGRLYVDRWAAEVRVMDITLLPEFRGQGHGSRLLRGVQAEARAAGLAVSIHVERFNPARRLYERLGFQVVEDSDSVYLLMRWEPTATPPGDPQPCQT